MNSIIIMDTSLMETAKMLQLAILIIMDIKNEEWNTPNGFQTNDNISAVMNILIETILTNAKSTDDMLMDATV